MADTKKYRVHSKLHHDRPKPYEDGETVHLNDEDAAPLLAVGVVSLHDNDSEKAKADKDAEQSDGPTKGKKAKADKDAE